MSAATSGEDYSPWQGWGGHMEDFKVKCLLLNVCCLVRLTVFPELQGSSGTGAVPPRIGVPGGLIPPLPGENKNSSGGFYASTTARFFVLCASSQTKCFLREARGHG